MAQYTLPSIRYEPPTAWDLWFQTRYGRPAEVPEVEDFWSRLAGGDREAVSRLYNWLGAYTSYFAPTSTARQLAAAVSTYGTPDLAQSARLAATLPPMTRRPDFGWENWRWGVSDVRWGAFLEGLRSARQKLSGMKKKEEGSGEQKSEGPPPLPTFTDTAFNWLEQLGQWGLKWKIDPVDINNRYLRNRWEKMQAARELQRLMKIAPSEQLAEIGRAMVGDFGDLQASSPLEEAFGYFRGPGRGTPFAYRNTGFR